MNKLLNINLLSEQSGHGSCGEYGYDGDEIKVCHCAAEQKYTIGGLDTKSNPFLHMTAQT